MKPYKKPIIAAIINLNYLIITYQQKFFFLTVLKRLIESY